MTTMTLPKIPCINPFDIKNYTPQRPYDPNRIKGIKPQPTAPKIEVLEGDNIFDDKFKPLFYALAEDMGKRYGPRVQLFIEKMYLSHKNGIQSGYCTQRFNLWWSCLPHRKVMGIIKCKSLTTAKKVINILRGIGLMVSSPFIQLRKNRLTGRVRTCLYHAFNPAKILEFFKTGVFKIPSETVTDKGSAGIPNKPFFASQVILLNTVSIDVGSFEKGKDLTFSNLGNKEVPEVKKRGEELPIERVNHMTGIKNLVRRLVWESKRRSGYD